MAGVIYQNVFDMLQISPNTILYDLYCGTGTMGTCLAPFVKEVHAVEINYDAIVDAKENLQLNSISNLHLHHGDVEKVLQTLSRQDVKPDVVIVDPPRAGLSEKSTKLIIEQQPGQIIYVACNPQTQSENILAFLQSGYEVAALQPIDQFAQTYHVENIIKLILMYPQTS